jgi:hypothetical protein
MRILYWVQMRRTQFSFTFCAPIYFAFCSCMILVITVQRVMTHEPLVEQDQLGLDLITYIESAPIYKYMLLVVCRSYV